MYKSLIHLNNHLMVATDCETTGLNPDWNEIWQISCVPLDSQFNVVEDLPIFDINIRINHPERISPQVSKAPIEDAMLNGLHPEAAYEAFEAWFDSLGCPEGKRLVPLAHNWGFEHRFYVSWLGYETFNHFFDTRARDTMQVATFLQDRADFDGEHIPFAGGVRLQDLAKDLGIPYDRYALHTAVYDSALAAQVYKELLKRAMF